LGDDYGYLTAIKRPQVGSEQDPQRITTTEYNFFGQLKDVYTPWQWDNGSEIRHHTHYDYDDASTVIAASVYPDPLNPNVAATTRYVYNGLHQLSEVCQPGTTSCDTDHYTTHYA